MLFRWYYIFVKKIEMINKKSYPFFVIRAGHPVQRSFYKFDHKTVIILCMYIYILYYIICVYIRDYNEEDKNTTFRRGNVCMVYGKYNNNARQWRPHMSRKPHIIIHSVLK